MVKIFTVTFLLYGDENIFLNECYKYFPGILRKVFLKRSMPKYEEYIRNINGIETKLEFFIFPKMEHPARRIQKIYNYIHRQRSNNIIFLDKPCQSNVHINCYLTYYILKGILKKYGWSFKNKKVGIVGIEKARKEGFLYEIAEQVEVLYVLDKTLRFERIADELLGEFGIALIKAYGYKEAVNEMDIVFVFDEENLLYHPEDAIICYPEHGIVEDGILTKKLISLNNVKVDFLPLKDIVVYGKMPFCNLSPSLIGVLSEKLLFTHVTNFSEAKSIFTKSIFDVKIEFN